MKEFYSYVHARPDGRVFYVGKGHGARAQDMVGRNPYHQNVINKYGAENIRVGKISCSSEEIAFDLERGLIKCLRRMGVELTNMTDGGDGILGYNHTEETKQQLSNLFDSPEYREKHRTSVVAAHVRSKEKYRRSAKESQNREEVKARHREYQGSPEVVEAKSVWAKKAWSNEEKATAWSAAISKSLQDPEIKQKRSENMKGKNAGRISIMQGTSHRMVFPDQVPVFLSEGWVFGNPASKGRTTTKGRMWVSDGKVNRMVYPDEALELLASGWKRGQK